MTARHRDLLQARQLLRHVEIALTPKPVTRIDTGLAIARQSMCRRGRGSVEDKTRQDRLGKVFRKGSRPSEGKGDGCFKKNKHASKGPQVNDSLGPPSMTLNNVVPFDPGTDGVWSASLPAA